MYGSRTDHYPATSKLLHWLIAASVLTTVPVAITMTRIAEGPLQNNLYNLHKSLGVLILVLMILRVINRFAVGAPIADPRSSRGRKCLCRRAYVDLCVAGRHADCGLHR